MADIKPFEDIPYVDPSKTSAEAAVLASAAGGQQQAGNFMYLQVGSGATAFKVDPDGMWLGADVMADAPFSCDMLGNVILNSVLISGLSGATLAGAFDDDGNIIAELITSTLDTQAKQILGEFTFVGSGALAIKTDADNGLWISPTGILAKKSGANTFALDNNGDASFAGTLIAASGTFGTITAGTLTGVKVISNSSGRIISIDPASNAITFYDGSTYKGQLKMTDDVKSMQIDTADDIYFTCNGSNTIKFTNDAQIRFASDAGKIRWASGRTVYADASSIRIDGILIATGDIQTGGTFKSSDGSSGQNFSHDLITSIFWDSGTLKARRRTYTFKDGLCTGYGSENTFTP